MTRRFFYSLPPAGTRIPISLLFHSSRRTQNDDLGNSKLFNKYLNGAHTLYISSGRAALWLILKALSSINTERKKIILPAYTCPAVASAVLKAGLQPVLCDINLNDLGYSQDELENLLNEEVLALIVVHLFGFPVNVPSFAETCKKYGIFVVEDAAQAFGNEDPSTGKKLGLLGDVGFFSFGRGKPISALHGGLVATGLETIYDRCLDVFSTINDTSFSDGLLYWIQLALYYTFSNPYLYWVPQSMPFLHLGETRFESDFSISTGSSVAAGVIGTLIGNFEADKIERIKKTQWYQENLPASCSPARSFSTIPYPFLRYPLIVEDTAHRDTLLCKLPNAGISGELFYPSPLNELPVLRDMLCNSNIYPNAKMLSERLATLPVHSGTTEKDMLRIKHVVESIES